MTTGAIGDDTLGTIGISLNPSVKVIDEEQAPAFALVRHGISDVPKGVV